MVSCIRTGEAAGRVQTAWDLRGDLVGATRESINKQMRAWGEEGLIGLERGYVVILDADALEQLAGCVIE